MLSSLEFRRRNWSLAKSLKCYRSQNPSTTRNKKIVCEIAVDYSYDRLRDKPSDHFASMRRATLTHTPKKISPKKKGFNNHLTIVCSLSWGFNFEGLKRCCLTLKNYSGFWHKLARFLTPRGRCGGRRERDFRVNVEYRP